MFFNIHSHQAPINEDEFVIQNLYELFSNVNKPGNYSVGLHPWFIKQESFKSELAQLEEYSRNNNVFAIGECGLDRNCKTDFYFQEEVFRAQIILANDLQKPIIIHCVNAYDTTLQILKQKSNKVPVVFHGFNKKILIAQKIVAEGYCISFGKALWKEPMQSVLKELPIEKIFFETDDDLITIESVYAKAAEILLTDIVQLQLQIKNNTQQFFGEGKILL